MASIYTQPIDENQCIGDSLDIINNNFQSLDTTFLNLSALNNVVVAFTCERVGTGAGGEYMGFGDGSKNGYVVMPKLGYLLGATLDIQGLNIGTITVRPSLRRPNTTPPYGSEEVFSGSAYELTWNVQGNGQVINMYQQPILFPAASKIAWKQQVVPSSMNLNGSYRVTFFVQYRA